MFDTVGSITYSGTTTKPPTDSPSAVSPPAEILPFGVAPDLEQPSSFREWLTTMANDGDLRINVEYFDRLYPMVDRVRCKEGGFLHQCACYHG